MSDPGPASALHAFTLERRMELSMNALAIFEYASTFGQEISSIWKRKLSGASILLFAVRYTMLCVAIISIFQLRRQNLNECTGVGITVIVLTLLSYLQTAAFSGLQVYALCGGNTLMSVTTFLLQLAPVAVNAYHYIESVPTVDPLFGCASDRKFSNRTNDILTYASRIPLTIGDGLVVVITWMELLKQLRVQRTTGVQFPLSNLLFRDGTAYFLLLLALNVLELSPLTSSESGFIVGGLASNLPLILVNRFMLNLRQLSDSEALSAGRICTVSTPLFEVNLDITGNMGEPLEHAWEARDDGELEVEAEEVSHGDKEARRVDGLEIEEVPRCVNEARLLGHHPA